MRPVTPLVSCTNPRQGYQTDKRANSNIFPLVKTQNLKDIAEKLSFLFVKLQHIDQLMLKMSFQKHKRGEKTINHGTKKLNESPMFQ